jgi:tRNA(fMet)-specific endonuclease VapC
MKQLAELAGLIPVVELPPEAGRFYGAIRAELEIKGEKIGNNDLWIAAHAKAAGLTLVTNNEREFRRIGGLKTQNWVS